MNIPSGLPDSMASETSLNQQHRALKLIAAISQALIRVKSESAFLNEFCELLVTQGGYRMLWIAGPSAPTEILACAGIGRDELIAQLAAPDVSNSAMMGRGDDSCCIQNGVPPPRWRIRPGAASVALLVEDKHLGCLNLVASQVDLLDDTELILLDRLVNEACLGLALHRAHRSVAHREAILLQAQQIAGIGHYHFDPIADRWTSSPMLDEVLGIGMDYPRTRQGWLNRVHPEDRARMTGWLDQKAQGQASEFDSEYRVIRQSDQVTCWVRDAGRSIANGQGVATEILGTIQDITAGKHLEQRLRESEAALQEAQAISKLGNWKHDLNTGSITFSEQAKKILGIASNSGLTVEELNQCIDPDDRERVLQSWQQKQDCDLEFRIKVGEHRRWIRSWTKVQFDEKNTPQRVIGNFQDVTDRHIAENELNKLSLAIEQSPHSIVITNASGEIEYVNNAFSRNTGYSREEAVGSNPRILSSGLTSKETFADLWKTLEHGEIWQGEFVNRRKDGSTFEEWAILSPVRQPDGHLTHYLAIKEDISAKKRDQAELERHRHHLESLVVERTRELSQAKEAAEMASRAKSAFLANMSHEIRTPMNAIIGLTYLALRDSDQPEQRERLSKVGEAAEHLMAIINDVLDISKIEAGKLQLEARDFSLQGTLRNAISLIAEQAGDKKLAVVVETDPALPKRLRGDPIRIQQILLNFLSNAIKFTEAGTITVSAQVTSQSATETVIRCAVHDNGIGISPEVQSRLFQPFEQADNSTTRRYGGTGLGLAICRRLVEAMQGEIGLDSQPDKGSTFWFTIPLQPSSADAVETAHDNSSIPHRWHDQVKILLAEDNATNEEVASALLHEAGMQVEIARNGLEALELARLNTYDLVLMDMLMPIMDGLEATRRIRALPGWASIPILAMTASAFAEDRANCLAAGMNDHVPKPFDPKNLQEALARWLPKHKLSASDSTLPATESIRQDVPTAGAIRKFQCLDVALGARAMHGNLVRFRQILERFLHNHRGDFIRIREQIDAGNTQEARRLAHSLKGAAGTLGATPLQQSATRLEAALRAEPNPPVVDRLLDELALDFEKLSQEMLGWPCENAAPAMSGPLALGKMRHYLQEGDVRSQELLRQHPTELNRILGSEFEHFQALVADFDFEAALDILSTSSGALQKEGSET